ncbi:MAG: AbrB/MazE/SpoVT family DNA-binding domain-containing protein [Gammaproteobacteria bacterium]|nr:AbrB/MazE/SpoVT family DNA-binding domain-containing protein [Gammaproteobacteria bacterium]
MNITLQIEANGTITLPSQLCEALHIHAGDLLQWQLNDSGSAVVKPIQQSDHAYLAAVSDTLDEWNSPEDEEAWRDL